ncbi:MAG: hypothetical protein IT430_12695 [Phycisphaerales bacterium]|nr:hypothetical protein [Phycisphaerales bacterium]
MMSEFSSDQQPESTATTSESPASKPVTMKDYILGGVVLVVLLSGCCGIWSWLGGNSRVDDDKAYAIAKAHAALLAQHEVMNSGVNAGDPDAWIKQLATMDESSQRSKAQAYVDKWFEEEMHKLLKPKGTEQYEDWQDDPAMVDRVKQFMTTMLVSLAKDWKPGG